MSDITLIPGEKLLIKLWETLVEKGIGSALRPWYEKRLGKTRNELRREELLMLAQAEKEAGDIRAGRASYSKSDGYQLLTDSKGEKNDTQKGEESTKLSNLLLRATEVEISEAVRKEINVAKAIILAEEILAQDTQEPPKKSIDDDWLYSWRDYAGKVSSADLQDLWGRILAGEVKNPGSYSIRTLEFIKALSKSEAEIISNVAQFVIEDRIYRTKKSYLEKKGITFSQLLFLQEIGIIAGVEAVGLTTTYKSARPDSYKRGVGCT